jgi:tRNA (5-methylaminomethyl-2-thiouridylate)-methyltransferase
MARVIIGMSGGIDSTIAAYLLSKQGYNVMGIHLRTWDSKDETGGCMNDRDWEDVQESCSILKIPCKSLNYTKEYWTMVFTPFLKQLSFSVSPNPDVHCNTMIKFGTFYDYCIQQENADYVASGHYARIINNQLLKGVDVKKDQSYYLSGLKHHQLNKILFPVGDLTKDYVKQIAKSLGMEKLLKKRESMGICFIGKRNFNNFIQEYIDTRAGNFIDQDGNIIGSHSGIELYTLGQKAKIGGSRYKLYVADKDPKSNRILVVPQSHPLLTTKTALFEPIWINDAPLDSELITIKHRYRQEPTPASISGAHITFTNPQESVTPGQHITVYRKDCALGGGPISGNFPRFSDW